ncbi:hypothetical protein NM688_g2316 [Phlebia brevispora]|uniref:Uncharacterized protein n=1 Tax=Phlebia brevispora TaxID=194682 RepID=A0ACC1T972_9APHY|nr:hypothetical protein NM688_g2316 [Phlebia brevispora]
MKRVKTRFLKRVQKRLEYRFARSCQTSSWELQCAELPNGVMGGTSICRIRMNIIPECGNVCLRDDNIGHYYRFQPTRAVQEFSRGSMNPTRNDRSPIPDDVIYCIARNMAGRKDLQSLSLCARSCRDPAQKEIFRHIRYTLKTRDWLDIFLSFLRTHPTLASYIQHLTLRNIRFVPNPRMNIQDVEDILKSLSGLQSLSISAFDWTPASPRTLTTSFKHSGLSSLTLLGITAIGSTASPLQILGLADRWREVHIEAIAHALLTAPPTLRPVSTHILNFLHYPLRGGTPIIPSNLDIFQNVVNFTARYIAAAHISAIAKVIRRSSATLQSLQIRVVRFETFTNMDQWGDIFAHLRSCKNLVRIICHLSLPRIQDRAGDASVVYTSLQASFTRGLLGSVSNAVRCIEIILDIRGSTKNEALRDFLQLGWNEIGSELRRAKNLEVVRVRLVSHDDALLRWHSEQYQALKAAFPQLTYHHGNVNTPSLIVCKAYECLPQALSLLCYSPNSPNDSYQLSLEDNIDEARIIEEWPKQNRCHRGRRQMSPERNSIGNPWEQLKLVTKVPYVERSVGASSMLCLRGEHSLYIRLVETRHVSTYVGGASPVEIVINRNVFVEGLPDYSVGTSGETGKLAKVS